MQEGCRANIALTIWGKKERKASHMAIEDIKLLFSANMNVLMGNPKQSIKKLQKLTMNLAR